MAIRKRADVNSLDDVVHNSEVMMVEASSGLEALAEYLVLSSFEDGSPRQRGTVLLFVEGGKWKLCFNDKSQSMVGFATVGGLADALMYANEALAEDKVDWRLKRDDASAKRR